MMKKYFLLPLLIALIPNMVFGASARYSKLLHEKQRKMEQLEKCMGASKGLQVAGVSTLGLTAVGVAGNIWEAQTIKDNESTIDKNKKNIGTLEKQIQKKKDEQTAKKAEQQQVKSDTQTSEINNFKTSEDLEIFINTLSLGDVTIGSSLSIPTDLLSTEGVSEKINNWKDLCDAACHEEGTNCSTEKVDEKEVGENTVYTCLIDTCKEEGVKFKKSEDGLKCELDTECANSHWSEQEIYPESDSWDGSGIYVCKSGTCSCYNANEENFHYKNVGATCCEKCSRICASESVRLFLMTDI